MAFKFHQVQGAAEKADGSESRYIENRQVFLPHPVQGTNWTCETPCHLFAPASSPVEQAERFSQT